MRKSVQVLALLFTAWSTGWGQQSITPKTGAPATKTPGIVARVALRNQTEPIPTTTIFVPKNDGVFRLSLYMTLTKTAFSNNNWVYQLNWTDEAGPESNFLIFMPSASVGCALPAGGFACGPVITFEAKAGQPITYQVEGTADGSSYAMFFVIERLM